MWEGNDLGDFQLKNKIAIDGSVNDFAVGDVNNDGLNDIVVATNPAMLQVIFNNDIDAFSDRIEYASGKDPQSVLLYSSREKSLRDCIVLDRNGQQFNIHLSMSRLGSIKDSINFVTGVNPAKIVANDFNRDSVSDIALLNTESQSISIYWGRNNMSPYGPFSYSLIGTPKHLRFHSSTDTLLHFVITFPQLQQISYFTLDANKNSITNTYVTAEGDVQFLLANLHQTGNAEFVTLNTTTTSEGSAISFFEQLGSTTFIERTFRLVPPDYLLGASVIDLNRDSLFDIVYTYRPGDTSQVELGVAFGDSSYSMKQRVISKDLALPNVKQTFLWFADFDKDSVLDLLMYAGSPVEYLCVARGQGEGLFYDPKIVGSGLSIRDRSDVQIVDVDGDTNYDVAVGLSHLDRVIWFRGLGDCNFVPEQQLVVEKGFSHYVVVDINADGLNDLAMTMGKRSVLKIINGKQLPFRKETMK
jgi:hypothetical protein